MSQSASTSYEKISLSVPTDLFEELDRMAQAGDESRSQTFVRFLRQGLAAGEAAAVLNADLATLGNERAGLMARLAEAEARPPPPIPDFQDFLTGSPSGLSKLRRDLDLAERRLREEAGKAADGKRAEAHWHARARDLWAALEQAREAAEGDKREGTAAVAAALEDKREAEAAAEARIAGLRQEVLNRCAEVDRAEAAWAEERARRVPWHWNLPLPVPRFFVVDVPYRTPHRGSWLRGMGWGFAVVALALLPVPFDSAPMRRVATMAMGTWGDVPKAAARLHGGPLMGGDTLLQVYALLRAEDNPKRLRACFERALAATEKDAAKTAPRARQKRPVVDCTIRVPDEFALYLDVATSGPYAGTSGIVRNLRRVEQRQAAVDKSDRSDRDNRQGREAG